MEELTTRRERWILAREDEVRERIPHTWTSSNDSFLKSILSSEAIFKEAPDWPLWWRNEILNMRVLGNANLK